MRNWMMALFGAGLMALASTAQADNWREAAPMESARTQVRAVAVSDQIYVAGGSSLSGPSDVFEAYDPRSDRWHPLQSMPEGRDMFGMAAQGGMIYVAGGLSSWNKGQPSASVYAYDTQHGVWTRRADMPAPRVGHTLTAIGDYLYAIGGRGDGGNRVVRYDTRTDKWTAFGAPLPSPRTGHGAAASDNKIYLIAGRSLDGEALSRVDVFDASDGHWTSAAGLPIAATGLTADFVGAALHVAGGVAPSRKRTLSEHFALTQGAWRKLAALPTPRQGLASAALGGKWFVIGGGAGSGVLAVFTETDAVEVYTP